MLESEPRQTAVLRFIPDRVRRFRFTRAGLDAGTGRIELGYALDGPGVDEEMHEVVDLGVPVATLDAGRRAALGRALRVLHLVAGVSYYKTSFAPEVVLDEGPVSPGLAAFLEGLYRHGLAECRYVNGLAGRAAPAFASTGHATGPGSGTAGHAVRAGAAGLPDSPLVPVGGGKDSIVALEAVRRTGRAPLLFSVGTAPAVSRTVEVAGLPHVGVTRRLDPRLLELNRAGAHNGHVPVTAIVSCLAVIAALVHGTSEVVMADERSASVGSLTWDGAEVNHQYSKSWGFERRFAAVVRAEIAGDLDYFSLLRPWSELAIARSFAAMTAYHQAFVSCNRAYLLDADRRTASWCGDCPKCRFVALALAPFLEPERLVAIMGRDLLADASQTSGFAALLGLGTAKPLECVGEVEESRAAMRLLLDSPWRDTAVVRSLGADPSVRELSPEAVGSVFRPSPEHALPTHYRRFADGLD
ncbi:MAG TPA: endonuclease domain-containing protein [Candidatus Binatia bacterium]|nr:endonuclease domain-containing protein [Candidatus Binatia bacterium]